MEMLPLKPFLLLIVLVFTVVLHFKWVDQEIYVIEVESQAWSCFVRLLKRGVDVLIEIGTPCEK